MSVQHAIRRLQAFLSGQTLVFLHCVKSELPADGYSCHLVCLLVGAQSWPVHVSGKAGSMMVPVMI